MIIGILLSLLLSEPPKFHTKKPSMPKEPEKMVGKVKSVENDMKNSPGLMDYEDVSYKNWVMSSSVNLPPSFETSKFREPDGQKDSVKHLGRHCNQPRETEGKKKENAPIIITGHSRSFDPNVRCAYHSDVQGHSTEDCHTFKREIEKIIQDKLIVVQIIGPSSSSPARGTAQYVGDNDLGMGIQSLFVEGNVSDSGGSSNHVDMQTSG
ncbi:hypothetical protein P3S67_027153 [Capsicum chacoense]